MTRLGENISGTEEADQVAADYLTLLDRIAADELNAEISVKLTQLGLDIDEERTSAHVLRLVERAARYGRSVWIDISGAASTPSAASSC